MAQTVPDVERSVTYSAAVDLTAPPGPPLLVDGARAATAPCAPGVVFLSEPFDRDTVLAGYSKLALWVASTSPDMDVFVALRVLDDMNREVDFCGPALIPGISTEFYPLAKGWLKVSHRKLDPARSSEFRPKHTHLRVDHAPLRAGETVAVEIEIIPNTGLVRKGHRLRLDLIGISAASKPGLPGLDTIDVGGPGGAVLEVPALPAR